MRVLLVEPQYMRRRPRGAVKAKDAGSGASLSDETLAYPPLGLMKLARFHKERGDEVRFVRGCDATVFSRPDLFTPGDLWDRVYITTLFTYHFKTVAKTIRFYLNAVGGTKSKVFVGGIMASLMSDDLYEETGLYPVTGVLNSPKDIGLRGKTNIDELPPDYEILDGSWYAINETYYAYATRGCTNTCPWCGVPKIEPRFVPYIDVKPMIKRLRADYGDKPVLKLMDNNVLASPRLEQIVEDLVSLGYGRGSYTESEPRKERVIDFNQGLDATHLTKDTMALLSQLNIKPMRIAFDRVKERRDYVRALSLARKFGVTQFSNYMLYNFRDTPRDLYERLMVNIKLNEEWVDAEEGRVSGKIYSYPMRYAPITNTNGQHENRSRDFFKLEPREERDWLKNPVWTKRFVRNVEIMKGAAHGAISPTPSLARRTIGATFEEFLANLYMPEELLRNRNKYEKKVYPHEPKRRKPGNGKVEEFRRFILKLLRKQGKRFYVFHSVVAANSVTTVKEYLKSGTDRELKKWLRLYVKR